MDFSIVLDNIDTYNTGLLLTLQLTIISVILGFVLAWILVWLHYQNVILSSIAKTFIYFFRGTPLLVQIYLIYYGLGQLDIVKESFLWEFFKEPYFCALLSLVLNNAAYSTEIFRSSIINTQTTEIEAAKAYGMNKVQRFLFVVFPSSIRRAIPAYSNEIIFMLHATSLCSTITLVELTGAARVINTTYYSPFEAFIFAALFYIVITFVFIGVFKLVENKLNKHLLIVH